MKKLLKLSALTAILIGLSVSALRAQVIFFNNLGTTTLHTPQNGWTVGFNGVVTYELAFQFTAQGTGLLDYADLGLWTAESNIGRAVNVAIYSDAANIPGAILEQSTSSILTYGTNIPYSRAEFSNSTSLVAGSKYWLAVSPANNSVVGGWEWMSLQGTMAIDVDQLGFSDPWGGFGTYDLPGARVVGLTAVPEASTYGLLGVAALLTLIAGKRVRAKICGTHASQQSV